MNKKESYYEPKVRYTIDDSYIQDKPNQTSQINQVNQHIQVGSNFNNDLNIYNNFPKDQTDSDMSTIDL